MTASTCTKPETVIGIEQPMETAFWIERVAAFKTLHPRLYNLAWAIQEFEGWEKGSRSFRNNNPGNLRYSRFCDRVEDGFVKFPCYHVGLFALIYDLWCKCSGKTSTNLTPESTLVDLFQVYAPFEDDNDPDHYAHTVAARLGIDPETRLSRFLEA